MTVFEGGNIPLEGTTNARVRAADFSANPLATGLEISGKALGEFAQQQEQLNEIHDDATVKEAANSVSQQYATIGYTGPDAYFNKGGKDALLARPNVETNLDATINQAKNGLKTERQRRLFDDAIAPQRTAWGVQIAQHADKETKSYGVQESTARLSIVGQLARQTWLTDPVHGDQQITTGLSEVDTLAKLNDWGPDTVKLKKLEFTTGAYKDIGMRLAYEGGSNGPALAEGLVKHYGDQMTADDRDRVLTHARVSENSIEAERRRLEAEAKRADREAKSDAKDRAEAVYRNIQDGVPVEDKDLAGAQNDARSAGLPALEESIRQDGLKVGLTRQYATATTVELRNRINELSVEITKEGSKVKPDTVVARDHLQTLLQKTTTALNTDPLSFAATNLGMNVGTLNLNDPGSIRNRTDVATTVANRYGVPARVMTEQEAALQAPILRTGSIAQKTNLVTALSKFGPYALDAARQIDPNNVGFHNLVGLASHQNRGVAVSRVNQAIEGYEVLKTMPKLVNKKDSVARANQDLGNSLQFMPSVKEGVISNAGAILATDANEHGYSDWNVGRDRWYAAVNSALGAYTRNGQQIGGLHTFNGGVTIVPEEMSTGEFEARISRAQGPQFKAAQNGTPHYSDGRQATASQVKKMQWVPARDGVYRLTDGVGFLRTDNGGFYEIDARKLP